MQTEPGVTSDRFSGSRAATTFRKEPRARPGARAIAARPISLSLSAVNSGRLTIHFVIVIESTVAPVFGGIGAPTGMFLITGSGMNTALLKVLSNLPMLIGPSTVTPFLMKVIDDEGWHQSEPWKVWLLSLKVIPIPFDFNATSVSIELLPLAPCQFVKLHGLVAQSVVEFPFRKTLPLIVSALVVAFQLIWPVPAPLWETHV